MEFWYIKFRIISEVIEQQKVGPITTYIIASLIRIMPYEPSKGEEYIPGLIGVLNNRSRMAGQTTVWAFIDEMEKTLSPFLLKRAMGR